jgi:chaperonin cofactor prefoldin
MLVDQILKLREEKLSTKLSSKIEQLQSKIEYCENRINRIVYQLYELTEEEIKIVEGR